MDLWDSGRIFHKINIIDLIFADFFVVENLLHGLDDALEVLSTELFKFGSCEGYKEVFSVLKCLDVDLSLHYGGEHSLGFLALIYGSYDSSEKNNIIIFI